LKTIIIKSQEEFDKILEVKVDEELICECDLYLKFDLNVLGKAIFRGSVSWGQATVEASDQATVRAWGQATVRASDQATVEALDQATVEAWGQATVRAWGQATVRAWGQATVEAWGQATVRILSAIKSVVLFGFSVAFKPFDLKIKIKKSKTAYVQNIKPLSWFENNGFEKKKTIILYKKVSKDFLTQEGTPNETKWKIGTTVTHPNWLPDKEECGPGKFHACSRPYFCDEFRNMPGDKYISISVKLTDVFEWKNNPQYPHKIGFREGKVLCECDSFGNKK
jgi:hypothetical protein